MFRIGDFVQGYEAYKGKKRLINGYVQKIFPNGDIRISCNDWRIGFDTHLLELNLGEIKLSSEIFGYSCKT